MLENASARLIVSPTGGGRALALVDKSTGFDLLSSVGALRDAFSFSSRAAAIAPESAPGGEDFVGRAYEAAWIGDGKNAALGLHYHAADALPGGADVEKRVQLDGDEVKVSYRVALSNSSAAQDAKAASSPGTDAQVFIASQSVPALDEPGRLTKFCWSAAPLTNSATNSQKDSSDQISRQRAAAAPARVESSALAPKPGDEPPHCQDFAPGGEAIEIPAEAKHLEVRTSGRPGLAVDGIPEAW